MLNYFILNSQAGEKKNDRQVKQAVVSKEVGDQLTTFTLSPQELWNFEEYSLKYFSMHMANMIN